MNDSLDNIKVATVQHSCSNDIANNERIVRDGIVQAAQQGANLVLLQELHDHVYFCQQQDQRYFDLARPIPNDRTNALGELARRHKLVIIASVFEKRTKGIYHNTAVVIEKTGEIVGTYRKMHIPDDPGFNEKFYFSPGEQGFQPIATSVGKLGVMICWDQWFPEAARLMALAGADILLYPTAIGWNPDDEESVQQRQLEAWITIQRSHAIANALPVMVCNRVGFEASENAQSKGLNFWGSSFVADSMGEILCLAPQTCPENKALILFADINYADTEKQRREWPLLRDRRIDYYNDIILRYRD